MRTAFALLVIASLFGCAQRDSGHSRAADAVYINGSIWTGIAGTERAEAIAVSDGRIIFVGDTDGARAFKGGDTKLVDLAGKFVTPGFIDNHTHFLRGAFGLASVQLRDAATPEAFARRIGDFAKNVPEGRWIRGGDWDHELWGGELPRKEWIDDFTGGVPVFVTRLDGHMGLANSAALALAGIDAATPDPDGGEIVRDDEGEPTGILKDAAMDMVERVVPPVSEKETAEALASAQAHALSRGVTQIHDMSGGGWESLAAFRRARENGALKLRVYSFVPLKDWEKLAAYVADHGRGDELLRWGGLKGYVDGSLGSTTAWFYESYDDAPETNGFTISDPDMLESWIAGADAAGLHVTVHAIGDQANDWLLEAFSRTAGEQTASRRFRVEHAQHLTEGAIRKFAELGVIASMQPYHAIDDGRWAEKRIGAERIKLTYAFRSLIDAGAILTFGSDWTVAPIEPLFGIYAAVTRRTIDGANPEGWVPEQKITIEETLRAYTAANAYAGFQENDLGTIEVGKFADFVVLSDDLFAIDPAAIADVSVLRTVINGETVYAQE